MKTYIIGYVWNTGLDAMPKYREIQANSEGEARRVAEALLLGKALIVDCEECSKG